MGVFVLNVRPHVCRASISPGNSTYNQYVIVVTILLIHSCGPKRIANYFCQDLFKVTGVTALSVMVGLLSTIHILISEVASSARLFVHPPLPRIQGWLHVAVHSRGAFSKHLSLRLAHGWTKGRAPHGITLGGQLMVHAREGSASREQRLSFFFFWSKENIDFILNISYKYKHRQSMFPVLETHYFLLL